AAGVLAARGRWRLASAGVALFAVAATSFWVLVLARPYGLLVDANATIRAADCAVAATAGGQDGFLIGEPPVHVGCTTLARVGMSASLTRVLPSAMPIVVLLVTTLAFGLLVRAPAAAAVTAALWVAASSVDLDAVRGVGLLPSAWSHPRA